MESLPDSFAVLPIEGVHWLCRTRGPVVQPLAKAPGMPDARFVLAPDASAFAVLDSKSKRAGLFRILEAEPWFETVLAFESLPRRCIGHALAVAEGSLLIGGQSRTGEALWIRTPGRDTRWRVIPVPERLRAPGKAIDSLLVDGTRVVAVDDLVFPKWVIVYRVEEPGELREIDVIELPVHTSYEQVHVAALGTPGVALISRGVNHGVTGVYISILDSNTFREISCWSGSSAVRTHQPEGPVWGLPTGTTFADRFGSPFSRSIWMDEAGSLINQAILDAADLCFVGEQLLVACGTGGLLKLDLREWEPHASQTNMHTEKYRESQTRKLVFHERPGMTCANRIVVPTPPDAAGVFVVGKEGYWWTELG